MYLSCCQLAFDSFVIHFPEIDFHEFTFSDQTTLAPKTQTALGLAYFHLFVLVHCALVLVVTAFVQLKLVETQFRVEFLAALDVPWPTKDVATVRTVPGGARSMMYILV
ncbi:hypothetical protein B0H13DRAFT_2300525 [Mycena leptocephala]|nr:hypothetical protein B0H13DRAFT_2300525 [Mycena leptocephala]